MWSRRASKLLQKMLQFCSLLHTPRSWMLCLLCILGLHLLSQNHQHRELQFLEVCLHNLCSVYPTQLYFKEYIYIHIFIHCGFRCCKWCGSFSCVFGNSTFIDVIALYLWVFFCLVFVCLWQWHLFQDEVSHCLWYQYLIYLDLGI